ncbi:MAG: diphthine--ammonia ligase [Oscillospiraceae bacterium]|jgi:uncharacterized protein (TIGR00290 family)|nr:diphthine--ammonia ligase [Oscillospiraceae bacterium]
MIMKFAISYSGGKDSALAMYRMIKDGHTPVALISTMNTEQQRTWFHGIRKDLLEAVSGSLDIPLIACECVPDEYAQAFESSLMKARDMGATACVFGDIDIEDHRQWDKERCDNAGLDCIFPLWKQSREALVRETIEAGFKALIKIVQSDKLGESFLGKDLTLQLIESIIQTGSDACGENGEYHTFVYDGPTFREPITIEYGGIVDLGTHKAIDILLKLIDTSFVLGYHGNS